MRTILILALLVIGMFVAGWLRFSGDSNTATITIDKQEIRKDTEPALQKVRDFVDQHAPPTQPVDARM